MNGSTLVLIVVIILTLLVVLGCLNNGKESFGQVMGALGQYQKPMYECISECERQDPSRRLLKNSNWNCGEYCASIFTEIARQGIPPESLKIRNTETDCEKQCSDYSELPSPLGRWFTPTYDDKRKCISMCQCEEEVAKFCKEQNCPWTSVDEDVCMEDCIATQMVNCNQVSWNWKQHS